MLGSSPRASSGSLTVAVAAVAGEQRVLGVLDAVDVELPGGRDVVTLGPEVVDDGREAQAVAEGDGLALGQRATGGEVTENLSDAGHDGFPGVGCVRTQRASRAGLLAGRDGLLGWGVIG